MQKTFSKAHFGEFSTRLDIDLNAIERVEEEKVLTGQEIM